MRERKRLEEGLATDAELGRRVEDIAAYFELAAEGEAIDEAEVTTELASARRELDSAAARLIEEGLAAWSGGDAGVYAGGDGGDGEGCSAGRA